MPINIFITSIEGKSVTFWLPHTSTIQFVKMLVEDKFPKLDLTVPNWNFCYFVFQSKVIYDCSQTLLDLGVQTNNILRLRVRAGNCPDRPCLHIKMIHESAIKDAAKAAATISHFKSTFKSVASDAANAATLVESSSNNNNE